MSKRHSRYWHDASIIRGRDGRTLPRADVIAATSAELARRAALDPTVTGATLLMPSGETIYIPARSPIGTA